MGSKDENSNNTTELDDRFYQFSLKIIILIRKLPKEIAAVEISRQLVRSATSIIANYSEAKGAFSKDDFIYKISLAFKESRESYLWLSLLKDSGIASDRQIDDLLLEAKAIRNILGTCVKTAKRNKCQE